MHFLPIIGTLHMHVTMSRGLLWQELRTNLYSNLILTLSTIVHNKVRTQNQQCSRCPKFEFLCIKMHLAHVGIVQKVPKVKKSARLIESRESSRWLTPLLLCLGKLNHTRSMFIIPIYMEVMIRQQIVRPGGECHNSCLSSGFSGQLKSQTGSLLNTDIVELNGTLLEWNHP